MRWTIHDFLQSSGATIIRYPPIVSLVPVCDGTVDCDSARVLLVLSLLRHLLHDMIHVTRWEYGDATVDRRLTSCDYGRWGVRNGITLMWAYFTRICVETGQWCLSCAGTLQPERVGTYRSGRLLLRRRVRPSRCLSHGTVPSFNPLIPSCWVGFWRTMCRSSFSLPRVRVGHLSRVPSRDGPRAVGFLCLHPRQRSVQAQTEIRFRRYGLGASHEAT